MVFGTSVSSAPAPLASPETAARVSSSTLVSPSPGGMPAIFSSDPAIRRERPSKVGKIDQGEQQASNPEDVHVSEQRQQAQHGDDLELQLMGLVCYALGQGVQAQEQEADRQNGEDQEHGHHHHKDVGLAGRGDERRQMMGCGRVQRIGHAGPL